MVVKITAMLWAISKDVHPSFVRTKFLVCVEFGWVCCEFFFTPTPPPAFFE